MGGFGETGGMQSGEPAKLEAAMPKEPVGKADQARKAGDSHASQAENVETDVPPETDKDSDASGDL
jgi:hypothetical protein